MTKHIFWARFFAFLLVFSLVLSPTASAIIGPARAVQAAPATQPVVAIHVSELTQALETMPAVAPTPTGTGFSGSNGSILRGIIL